jgi:hypothetical protein
VAGSGAGKVGRLAWRRVDMRFSGGVGPYATVLLPAVKGAVFPRRVDVLVGNLRTSCAMPRPSCGCESFPALFSSWLRRRWALHGEHRLLA